jgi:hypothetical protein
MKDVGWAAPRVQDAKPRSVAGREVPAGEGRQVIPPG